MREIALYDDDFISYANVIPSLECGKIYAYMVNHNCHVDMLDNLNINLNNYDNLYIQKNYDDGNIPEFVGQEGCIYGGRVFSPYKYIPLDSQMENMLPDFSCYNKIAYYFSPKEKERLTLANILKCSHTRLETLVNSDIAIDKLRKDLRGHKYRGLILHDYFTPNYDIVSSLLSILTQQTSRHLAIGNKFPFVIHSLEELLLWSATTALPKMLYIQYDNFIPNDVFIELFYKSNSFLCQLLYNPFCNCIDEKEFYSVIAPNVYKQNCFMRQNRRRLHLINTRPQTNADYISLFAQAMVDYAARGVGPQPLLGFVKYCLHVFSDTKYQFSLRRKDWETLFLYFKSYNPELFKDFYTCGEIIYKEGDFYNVKRKH